MVTLLQIGKENKLSPRKEISPFENILKVPEHK